MRSDQCFRVVGARITAAIPRSRIERLVRRIPGLGRIVAWIFRDRDAADRAWATAQVTVGDHACPPTPVADLPVAAAGTEISVSVTNQGDRSIAARVLVEGVKL